MFNSASSNNSQIIRENCKKERESFDFEAVAVFANKMESEPTKSFGGDCRWKVARVPQIVVLGAAHFRGERAEALEASSGEEVRLRDPVVLRDRRLRSVLRRSHGLQRRDENRQHAQSAVHGVRRAHRSKEESERVQGERLLPREFLLISTSFSVDNSKLVDRIRTFLSFWSIFDQFAEQEKTDSVYSIQLKTTRCTIWRFDTFAKNNLKCNEMFIHRNGIVVANVAVV